MSTYLQTFAGYDLYRSEQVVIQQNIRYRWLIFQDDACIQTIIHRRHPHKPAMPYLLPFTLALRTNPGPTCLLGLGGGAVIHMTRPYLQQYPITAVELTPEVIALSQQYFGIEEKAPLTIVQQEAQQFLSQNSAYYQHILIDLYSDTGFPQTCTQTTFFDHCKQHLAPNGFIAMNLVGIQQEFPVLQMLQTVFPHTTLCMPVPHSANMIVLATHKKTTLLDFVYAQAHLKSFIWDSLFGHMALFK